MHACKKNSEVRAKNGSVFFNCQYFINKLISDFGFWNVDRHK